MNIDYSRKSKNKSKYYIGICELYHELLHGFDENNYSQIKGHYLLMEKFESFHKYIANDVCQFTSENDSLDSETSIVDSDDENENYHPRLIDLYRYKYYVLTKSQTFKDSKHSIIRNYHNIVKSFCYIQPHIVECIYLPGPWSECIAILKTFWLKIIQRTWKRVYKERMALLCSVPMMRIREIRGTNANNNCCFRYEKIHIPGLRGMLAC